MNNQPQGEQAAEQTETQQPSKLTGLYEIAKLYRQVETVFGRVSVGHMPNKMGRMALLEVSNKLRPLIGDLTLSLSTLSMSLNIPGAEYQSDLDRVRAVLEKLKDVDVDFQKLRVINNKKAQGLLTEVSFKLNQLAAHGIVQYDLLVRILAGGDEANDDAGADEGNLEHTEHHVGAERPAEQNAG